MKGKHIPWQYLDPLLKFEVLSSLQDLLSTFRNDSYTIKGKYNSWRRGRRGKGTPILNCNLNYHVNGSIPWPLLHLEVLISFQNFIQLWEMIHIQLKNMYNTNNNNINNTINTTPGHTLTPSCTWKSSIPSSSCATANSWPKSSLERLARSAESLSLAPSSCSHLLRIIVLEVMHARFISFIHIIYNLYLTHKLLISGLILDR